MKIYTEVTITPHHSGFGMWQRGELQTSPEHSFAFESDLIGVVAQDANAVLPIDEAITDADFISAGVEDIRGRIHNQPSKVFVRLNQGELSYFGIEESEVSEDFFGN